MIISYSSNVYMKVNTDSGERYLIGSVCGLELGYGLETSSKPQAWKLLRQAPYSSVKQTFMDRDIRDAYDTHETWRYSKG